MTDLRNVIVRGGRIIHTADAPAPGEMNGLGHWYAYATCRPDRQWLREATVRDLDDRPRCRTCFPNGGAP